MTYNGLDTRVGMTDSTGSRTFRRAGIGVTSPVLSDGSASYTPSGENRAGVKTAYHGGLKSFDTQTSSAQAVVGQRLTDAFGNQISSSGVWKGRFAYGGPYGYQEDPDTGLRLLGHRYYDSSTGRFLTRDPIKDGRNWYAYCANNPVTFYDADGLRLKALKRLLALAIALLTHLGVEFSPETKTFGPNPVKMGSMKDASDPADYEEKRIPQKHQEPTRTGRGPSARPIIGNKPAPTPRSSGGGLGSIFTFINGAHVLARGIATIIPYIEEIEYWLEESMGGSNVQAVPSGRSGSVPSPSGRVVPSPGTPATSRNRGAGNPPVVVTNGYRADVLYDSNGGMIFTVEVW